MKLTSVSFSTPLPERILDGIKTQTRRIIKSRSKLLPPPEAVYVSQVGKWFHFENTSETATTQDDDGKPELKTWTYTCPYGEEGDQLWVKENFYAWGCWETRFSEKKGRYERNFIDLTIQSGKSYRYMDCPPDQILSGKSEMVGWWKRPSIFMPRVASRILLEITRIRVERLNDISEEDAIAEGAKADPCDHARRTCSEIGCYGPSAKNDFQFIWDSINGNNSWQLNPWVWCINFKVIEGDAK